MLKGFQWCPHCSKPHALTDRTCPETGQLLGSLHVRPRETASANAWRGLVLDRKYRLLSIIGTGGMGTVFEAECVTLNRRVAIKIAKAETPRLLREAQLVAGLHHPGICAVQDLGETPWGSPYVVFERLYGETLAQRFDRSALPLPLTLDIFAQILSALDAAHAASIVHRDIKAENIFLAERAGCAPVVKVLDFGFAKDLSHVQSRDSALTQPGWTCGTVSAMAPEQSTGGPIDHRVDIFATGIMLFTALTGQSPFKGSTAVEVQRGILRTEPIRLGVLRPDLPRAFGQVLDRALEKDPARRFPTALDFQRALASISAPAAAVQSAERRRSWLDAGPGLISLCDDSSSEISALSVTSRTRTERHTATH